MVYEEEKRNFLNTSLETKTENKVLKNKRDL